MKYDIESETDLDLTTYGTDAQDSSVYWVNLQKSMGPVYFNKIGITYQQGEIRIVFDAALILSLLKIELDQLGVGTPLNKIDPSFTLNGLSITYQSDAINISGGFLRQEVDSIIEYNGEAVIKLGSFNLSALGSYATLNGHPSLFIFALINMPLGGPPCFFVNGIAAGFGYNRSIKLPSINEVSSFPLVSGFVPNQTSPFQSSDPGAALQILVDKNLVPVALGENWIAAGIQFTSFELIQSYALLTVEFSTNLEIGILGLSTIAVPPLDPAPLVYAQMALDVRILPDKGLLAVDASLTPASYVFSQDCRLTGGFAFYVWTHPNPYEGDFVVTLGGYHPSFTPPDYYPKVPRLGFNWVLSSEFSIKGGIYFALTPTCVMAGGSLEALFHTGNLKAWFDEGADFLIAWKPYHYQADMYVNFGVSYTFSLDLLFTTITVNISVSLGADLNIWGPDFSGIAHIHLWIISFSISFGSTPNNAPQPISWDEFSGSFLPKLNSSNSAQTKFLTRSNDGIKLTDSYCKAKVLSGMIKDFNTADNDPTKMNWSISRNQTTFETNTLIPAKKYQIIIKGSDGVTVPNDKIIYTNQNDLNNRNQNFGVGLVDVENSDFESEHIITITYDNVLDLEIEYEVKAILSNVPKSLWEKRIVGFSQNSLISDVLVGFDITPIAQKPDTSLPIDLANFQFYTQIYSPQIMMAEPTVISGPDQKQPMETMQSTIDGSLVNQMRDNIIKSLINRGFSLNPNVDVSAIAKQGNVFILDPPILSYTYYQA